VRPASSKAPKWPSLVLLHRLLLSWVSAPTWTQRPKTDLRPKNRSLDPDGGFASRFISPVFTHFHPFSLFLPIFTHFHPFSPIFIIFIIFMNFIILMLFNLLMFNYIFLRIIF